MSLKGRERTVRQRKETAEESNAKYPRQFQANEERVRMPDLEIRKYLLTSIGKFQ